MSVAAVLLSAGVALAQNVKVTGTVTDPAGEPMVGVFVMVQGTTTGVSTDIDGKYSLNAPANGTLVFSVMGMKDAVVGVNNKSVINITMQEDAVALDDVVVTAMGIKKERKALGYSVTEMSSKELLKNKQTNVVNSLAGKVAGVNVTQSGGAAGAGSSIIIRGGNSVNESRDNQPLFVVDGIIYDNSTVNGGNSGTDGVTKTATTFSNRVMDINPEDIESMSVLKGAAAAALYGSRAADGVIVITTKKGTDGRVQVNFSSKYTYSTVTSGPSIQNVYGRGSYDMNGILQTDQITSSWGEKINGKVYDNVSDFFRGGNVWDNNLSISGGSKNGSFYLSASRYDQAGVIRKTGYDKTTFRFNGEQKYGKISVGANVSYSVANTKKTLTSSGLYSGGGNGTMTALYGWARNEDMSYWLNEDGTKHRMFPNQDPANDVENPYWIINKNNMTDRNERFTGAVNANANITDWLNVSYRVGVDTYNNDSYTYIAPGAAAKETYQNGRLSKSKVNYTYLTNNLMVNAHKTFGDFDFNLLVGGTSELTKRVRQSQWGWDFVLPGTISFGNILDKNKHFTESTSRKRLVGLYGEFRAAYKNIAYLTVTGRNDWSSTLPKSNQSYFYPSVSGSFVFTEVLPKNDILTFGKVRASWAKVGKDADPYLTNFYMWDSEVVNGNFTGVGNSWTGGSSNMKPEIQKSWEVGAELKFFNGRLNADFTYYNSKTDDQIISPRLAQSTGYIFLTTNCGSVMNKGIEVMLSGTPIESKNFSWNITVNMARNKGTLGDFITGVDLLYVTDVQLGGIKAASVPNGNFLALTGNRWLREKVDGKELSNGRYQVDAATGLYKLEGNSTNIVGNREPKLTGGISNDFRYKNLTLSFLLDFRIGGDIYNGTQYYLTGRGQSLMTAANRDKVTVTGVDSKSMEPVEYTYERGQNYVINGKTYAGAYMIQQYWSNYQENAYNFMTETNWLKLRSISLAYDFSNLIKGQSFIKNLTATVAATNLFTWTNYKGGMDPEVAAVGSGTGGSGSVGVDYCGVPSQRSFSFGVNLTF
ncbi:MAG: SusC/RagA family TonB-linked outer membrane protein [Bacteroidales bacterium]|nr:SusC/RagA family TonB-linked outer membrane protein [Candidatus Egerieousia equi]MCQ2118111.1 SusC/RagA family TonB-linked outer membrane protein [Bacteroidales bacterium]